MESNNFNRTQPKMSKMEHRRKTLNIDHQEKTSLKMKESRGILNQPPGSLPNKFTFEKDKTQTSAFCGCCPGIQETKT